MPLGVYDRDTKIVSSSTKNGGLADSETLNIPYSPCFPYMCNQNVVVNTILKYVNNAVIYIITQSCIPFNSTRVCSCSAQHDADTQTVQIA